MGKEDYSRLVYSTDRQIPRKDRQQRVPYVPVRRGLTVRLERKGRGGKAVSIIEGLGLDENGLQEMLKRLKTRLGTGGTIKERSIEIQGDHRDKICLLLEEAGYSPKKSGH